MRDLADGGGDRHCQPAADQDAQGRAVAVVPAALAPRTPASASPAKVTATMNQMRVVAVGPSSPRNGIRPPTRKLTAEAAEACNGRAVVVSA